MNHRITTLVILLSFTAASAQPYQYPKTRKTDQTDVYFGTSVADPYRWLEDDRSTETVQWVKEENATTEKYLSGIPFRSQVHERMTQLWNFPKMSAPFKGGKNYFVYTNDGLQNQYVLNILSDPASKPKPFLDPNALSTDGTVNIGGTEVSNDGKYMAYTVSSAGSDWNRILVRSTETGKDLKDTIDWVKFSGIAWKANGFYYSRYDRPAPGEELKGKNEFHKIYYHVLGTPQSADPLVYEDKEHPLRNFSASVTSDERFLIITGSEGTSGNNLVVKDLKSYFSGFVTLVGDFNNDYSVLDNDSTSLLVLTNQDASNYRLVRIPVKDTARSSWKEVLGEKKDVLQEAAIGKDYLIAKYLQDARSVLKLFTPDGSYVRDIPLETIGTVDQLSANKKDDNLFYSLTTFTAPTTIYRYQLSTGEQRIHFRPSMPFKSEEYVTDQVFYKSYDGTDIPMFIVHRKDMKTLLTKVLEMHDMRSET